MTLDEFREYLQQGHEPLARLARAFFPKDGEDALQSKIIDLLVHPEKLERIDRSTADAYFVAVVRNAVRDGQRRDGRGPRMMPLPDYVADPRGVRPEAILLEKVEDREQEKEAVRAALRAVKMSDKQRTAFITWLRSDLSRLRALESLGLAGGTILECHNVYDGPRFRAVEKVQKALEPHRELLLSIPCDWLWQTMHEVFCGDSPE